MEYHKKNTFMKKSLKMGMRNAILYLVNVILYVKIKKKKWSDKVLHEE